MAVCTSDLQSKLSSLKRTPPPNTPKQNSDDKPSDVAFLRMRLRPTNQSLTKQHEKTDDTVNENNDGVKKLSQMFENNSVSKSPIPPKTKVEEKRQLVIPVKPVKPNVPRKPSDCNRPPSVVNKPDPTIHENGSSFGCTPELMPLPSESAIGACPVKPPKLGFLKTVLEKYLGTSHPERPFHANGTPETLPPDIPKKPDSVPRMSGDNISNNSIQSSRNSIADDIYDDTVCMAQSGEIYDDTTPITQSGEIYDDTTPITQSGEIYDDTTPITQSGEIYDDTTPITQSEEIYDDTVNSNESQSGDIYDDTVNPTQSGDIYDDTVNGNDFTTDEAQDNQFGDDIYEPIGAQNDFSLSQPADINPPSLPAKDSSKEDRKKKEKERKQKEKEAKLEREREQKERKKLEKEKEKKINEMKKRFGIKGNEKSLGNCSPSEDIQGNRNDITVCVGDELEIIRKGKPNPSNKWLVRNKQGLYGYIDVNKITSSNDSEDLYEVVPTGGLHQSIHTDESNLPSPPTQSAPPPPVQNAPRPPAENQDIYDDVSAQEDLYEFLPEG
ncbi:uncharacterized protein DDB_G0284459-like isoform X3 [Xenia sp. Carnegie-2017]|uniref:uncharacterized protein DDB_G0284459-like isoform X2 n=1 Tax=Xenia sp. Carnegie-2017 TaxID=2897299 RepID=UPI001F035FB2|nr:uncharacterized protein DDB_G0284459-like isoform X2 [Xenia sp. Carnegie-2017]XP_046844283.1 uncharacterized protein DDB_G0284459-like isoform X3 [Xenia sp. Carnegie-2017]